MRAAGVAAAERVYTMGFCFGGRASFVQAARGMAWPGVIGFYGSVAGPDRAGLPEPAERVRRVRVPGAGIFGGADQGITASPSRPSTRR